MIDTWISDAPEQEYKFRGKTLIVRREDLAYHAPLPPNAKMSALVELVKRAKQQSYPHVALFAKKQAGTSYAIGLDPIAHALGINATIGYPNSDGILPDWLLSLPHVEIFTVRPNMITINVNQIKKWIEQQGGYFIPFGFEDRLSVETHARRFVLPKRIGSLILATMQGMTLAGTLLHLQQTNKHAKEIIGVSCGRSSRNIVKTMKKYVDLPSNLRMIDGYELHQEIVVEELLFPCHPDYELKAWHYILTHIQELHEPIYFINVGA